MIRNENVGKMIVVLIALIVMIIAILNPLIQAVQIAISSAINGLQ